MKLELSNSEGSVGHYLSNAWQLLQRFRDPNSGPCESMKSILSTELSPKSPSFCVFKANGKSTIFNTLCWFSVQSIVKPPLYPLTNLKGWDCEGDFQWAQPFPTFPTDVLDALSSTETSLLFLGRGINRGKSNIPLPVLTRGWLVTINHHFKIVSHTCTYFIYNLMASSLFLRILS